MKKNKKHQFTHPDPEKIPEKISDNKKHQRSVPDQDTWTAKDLKRVLIAIGAFTAILLGLYLLNAKLDLVQKFTDLL